MFSVSVRDHFMIAHSFQGAVFGPAQRLHGATYVADVELSAQQLDELGLVVDIALARTLVRDVLAQLEYRNLDEIQAFGGCNTTTEYLAKVLFDRLAARIGEGELGTRQRFHSLRITLSESHVARASYAATLPERPVE